MKITLRYLLRGAAEPKSIDLPPHEYFDPLEPGEAWEPDGAPRFNHARDYLPHGLDLAWTELEAPLNFQMQRVREVFSPDGRVVYWHRTSDDASEELCVSSQLTPESVHMVRLLRQSSGPWQLLFSTVVTDLPDGSQREQLIFSTAQRAPGDGAA